MTKQADVVIIGGGVIGVCAAYYLCKQGYSVTLLEKNRVASGCSFGNAGLVVPSHSVPLAAPGVMRQATKWLLNPTSPLYIKPRLNRRLMRWLWQFKQACTEQKMRRSLSVLRELNLASLDLYKELVDSEGLSFGLQLRGGLFLFNNNKYFAHGIEEAELLKSYGVEAHILSVAETRAIEPGISAAVIGGIVYPQDAHLIPDQFVQQLAEKVIQSGVKIEESTGVLEIRVKNNRITEVVTASETYTPDHVVLAAGVWSVPIAQKLGIELPVQPAKGYSMTIKRPPESPDLPLVLAERKVVMTPMGDSLRIAGTLELAGFNPTINARRVNAIRSAVPAYLNSKIAFEESLAWFGYRPLTPDTLPIIGPSLDVNNLVIATGHGMLGMSLGPITGKLVSQIINGDSMGFDTTQLNLRRFAWNPRSPGE